MQDRMLKMKRTLKYSTVLIICFILYSLVFVDISKAEEEMGYEEFEEQENLDGQEEFKEQEEFEEQEDLEVEEEPKEKEEYQEQEKYEEFDTEEVIVKPIDIEIEGYQEELLLGDTMNLSATVVPSNSTETIVTYKSSDNNVATVKSTGIVEGKKAGKVIIYVSCGDITKEFPITVKIKTKAIIVNSQYVVMQTGQEFKLEAKVVPATADNSITYKSFDENIVKVSKSGVICAKECGTTSVLISNGYSQVSVTVVVNKPNISNDISDEIISEDVRVEDYPRVLDSSVYKKIDKDMLQYYYDNDIDFQIKAKDYTINIDGKDIVNCYNEINTSLNLEYTSDDIKFELKDKICGKMILDFSEIVTNHKYLYLYNNDKNKYERIDVKDINRFTIDTEGKYLITNDKLSDNDIYMWYIIGGVSVLIVVIVGYVLVKRKYWFW